MGKREVDKLLRQLGWTEEMARTHLPCTHTERMFLERAGELGFSGFMHCGWPDFLLRDKAGDLVFVEVKSGPKDPLRKSQLKCFKVLESIGIDVFVWTPNSQALTPWRSHEKRRRMNKAERRALRNRRKFEELQRYQK